MNTTKSILIDEKIKNNLAQTFEEAVLLVSADEAIQQEKNIIDHAKIKDLSSQQASIYFKDKFQEHLVLKTKTIKLQKAAELVRLLEKVEKSSKESAVFLDKLQEALEQEVCIHLNADTSERIGLHLPVILTSQLPYLHKIAAIETFLNNTFKDKQPKAYEEIKKILIAEGDIELFLRVVDVSGDKRNVVDVDKLGENALNFGSPDDAQKAFTLTGNKDGLQKAAEIEKTKNRNAKEKLENIPHRLKTNGLVMHRTEYRFVENILKEGVLSLVQQFKKYSIHPEKKREPFNHGLRGSYNYVSVTDPWYGSETSADFIARKKEMREAMKSAIGLYLIEMESVSYDENKCKKLAEKYFAIWQKDSDPADFYITFEAATHPKWQQLMEKIENIFERYSEVKIDKDKADAMRYPEEKAPQNIDLNEAFIPDRGGIGLLLNPKLRRFSTLSGGCSFESLVKGIIKPEYIVGLLVGNNFFSELEKDKQEYILKYMTKIAQQNGLPLYEVSTNEEINLIWPK